MILFLASGWRVQLFACVCISCELEYGSFRQTLYCNESERTLWRAVTFPSHFIFLFNFTTITSSCAWRQRWSWPSKTQTHYFLQPIIENDSSEIRSEAETAQVQRPSGRTFCLKRKRVLMKPCLFLLLAWVLPSLPAGCYRLCATHPLPKG